MYVTEEKKKKSNETNLLTDHPEQVYFVELESSL